MKIWISTPTTRVQNHGRSQEDTIDEKDGMGAPWIVPEICRKHPKMHVPLDDGKGKSDLLCHFIMQEVNCMRDNIERALKEESHLP